MRDWLREDIDLNGMSVWVMIHTKSVQDQPIAPLIGRIGHRQSRAMYLIYMWGKHSSKRAYEMQNHDLTH